MNIIENFLPENVHKEYFEHYHSLNPTWRFVQKANSNADDTGNTYFMNETYHDTWKDKDGNPFKPAWEVVKLLEYLPNGYSKIIRAKTNLFIKQNEPIKYGMHLDYPKLDNYKILLYYINTNNGGTEFANGDFAKSVANRAVIVDGNIEHQTVGQTDADVRLIININYME